MFEVAYYAKCGNAKDVCQTTKGLAEVIASELGVKTEDIEVRSNLTKGTFVFLGCSCYGGRPGGKLSEFIAENDFQGRQVALFGTSLIGRSKKMERVEELLKPAGALIRGSFFCERKALPLLHRGRLSKEELTNAREFANQMRK